VLEVEEWQLVQCEFLEVKYVDKNQLTFMGRIYGFVSIELLPRKIILQCFWFLHSFLRAWLC
jgi:hypothetical protein